MKPGKNFKVQRIQVLPQHIKYFVNQITPQKSSVGSGTHPHTHTYCACAKCVEWGEVRLKVQSLFAVKDQKHTL